MKIIPVITIDGPGGSGKGTISHMLAEKLKWHFLDSGSLYRVLGLFALDNLDNKNELDNEDKLTELALKLPVDFKNNEIYLDKKLVTNLIRNEKIASAASKISKFTKVREALVDKQLAFRQMPGLVADGRDMGTVIFPDAKLKIYLDANTQIRAKRRHLQLKKQGQAVSIDDLVLEIKERDSRDKQRSAAPLKPAKDAHIIDTSDLNIDQVFAKVLELVAELDLN